MKRTAFLGIIGIFFVGLFLLPKISIVSAAGGTCTCTVGESRICGLTANNCAVGYQPKISNYSCTCVTAGGTPLPTTHIGASALTETSNTCSLLQDPAKTTCDGCMNQENHVWTAIGCVEATSTGLLNKFLPFAIGIAGGIAFLLILFGALQMMMSAGNPEKLNAGKELVTAAITGLLLIIFSIFILQLVGVTILKIPGFK